MPNRTIVFLKGHALRQSVNFLRCAILLRQNLQHLPIDRLSSASGICVLLATYICVPTLDIGYTREMYYLFSQLHLLFLISVLGTFCVEKDFIVYIQLSKEYITCIFVSRKEMLIYDYPVLLIMTFA